MKKIIISISAIVLILIAALTLATVSYAKTTDYSSNTLPDRCTVNGVDCSGLTYDEAIKKVSDEWNDRYIVVTGSLNEEIANFTDFGCTYDIQDEINGLKKQHIIRAAANHYFGTPLAIKLPMLVDEYGEDFKNTVVTADFLNRPDATESKSAYVDTSDPNFPIIPEVYGTKLETERFFNDVLMHIQTGELKFLFDERNYYTMPEITRDDKDLKAFQKYCKTYLKQRITYEMGESTFTITSDQLADLMTDDLSGNADEAAVAEFVAQLAATYDNVGKERKFTSLTGKNITVRGGIYGWAIDQEKETAQLTADINSHQDVSRKPIYDVEGYGEYSDGVGNTYIDVDISNQTVNYFKNGEKAFSCSVVTGCRVNGTTTPTGTFYVINKVRNVILRGDNVDGTRYESPVKYWMGINWGGIGFHDADWRSSFGGSIWVRNGSHGCINMPSGRIPALYNSTEVGTPVVVHY
ncbi:MAG: L,D-transpeptidase family protein [Bacillota bacterium]|nr:L,D-transpeptidase family protein [Bacillota bacterium]